ncbi:MAG TPA: hypothetical protein PLJ74_13510 [Myxococcota bacterium]|jgi:hypothetical protein|nr:hypothetical protein [Myxococcota bacterium]
MKTEDLEILASILNRWPLLPAERVWAQGFIERLQVAVAAASLQAMQATAQHSAQPIA